MIAMPLLSRTPYIPPPYSAMHGALIEGTTEAMYQAGVNSLAALEGVTVSAIAYDSDGLRVTGIEVLPILEPGEKIPLLIYNRGGSGDYGMLSPGQVTSLMAPFAQKRRLGVLASNYRGNGGSEGREEWGGSDVRDVLNLIALGKQQPWWDGKNVFMLGWSRGGMMTYLAIKHGAQVNAAVVGAGVTDLFDNFARRPYMETNVAAKYIENFAANRDALMKERSAVHWPEKITAPLLMLHGDADTRVHVEEARTLYAKLQALGKEVRYVEYPGGDHGLRRQWKEWAKEAADWFDAHRI